MDSFENIPKNRSFYPSLVRKHLGAIIDGVTAFGTAILSVKFCNWTGLETEWPKYILFYGIIICYEPVLTSKKYTLAQYLLKYRVRRFGFNRTWGKHIIEGKIGLMFAFWRFFVKWFLGFISLLTVPASKGHRAIHDKAANSIVLDISYLSKKHTKH